MPTTIEDVARYANVSKTTVSRFLNGVPGAMGEDTARRIAQAIEHLGYRPNLVARSLKSKQTQTIGVIVANILNPYSTEVTKGIEDICRERGYSMVLCNADDDYEKQDEYMWLLYGKQVDGLIVQPAYQGDDSLRRFHEETQCPIVILDRRLKDMSLDSVLLKNEQCSRIAVEHLLNLGHRRIGVLTSSIKGVSSRWERLQGYIQALNEWGIAVTQDYIEEVTPNTESFLHAIQELTSLPKPPSAVVALNGWISLEAMIAFKRLGIKIPKHLSFIGFDDPAWAKVLDPPLTVMAQPTYDMGCKAIEILLQQLDGFRSPGAAMSVEFGAELVVRESCRRIEV